MTPSTPVTAQDLSTIIELAEKATKGPWTVGVSGKDMAFINAGGQCLAKCDRGDIDNTVNLNPSANAAYIAAMSPDIAIEICGRLKALEIENASLKKRDWRQMQQAEFYKVAGEPSKSVTFKLDGSDDANIEKFVAALTPPQHGVKP